MILLGAAAATLSSAFSLPILPVRREPRKRAPICDLVGVLSPRLDPDRCPSCLELLFGGTCPTCAVNPRRSVDISRRGRRDPWEY